MGNVQADTAPVASLSHVTLRYDSGTQALEDVSLEVRAGERLCVLGANGSGKSTLASVLCGLLAPDTGSVTLVGGRVFDASRPTPIDMAAYREARRSLGLVFQNPDDQIVTTVVEEDVAFGPENLGVPADEIGRRVERELRRVAMEPFAHADPTKLSGGQKQRVAIAGALAMEPHVLVFDEPGALLDVRGRSAIIRVMDRLRGDGTTVVHITHFMEEALGADRVIVMEAGRVVLEGTPEDVFSHVERIASLGLEEPFCAQLASSLRERGVPVPWTCDDAELRQSLHELLAGDRADAPGLGDTHGTTAGVTCPTRSTAEGRAAVTPLHDGAAADCHIDVSRVSFAYTRDRMALSDVSFRLRPGASLAVVGHTGSGKSTLMRLLCALGAPDTGTMRILGVPTARKRDRRRLHGRIGYVMQHPERQLFAETVVDDVAFGPTNLGLPREEVAARCAEALRQVGLAGLEHASPFELSGGQQRLCALAGILAMEPRILVLDEPTAGLDPRGRRQLRRILAGVRAGGTTLVEVTHNMDDAALADEVLVLDEGAVMCMGTPDEVFCAARAARLANSGLGLPQPLSWAFMLRDDGVALDCDPLDLQSLVATVCRASRRAAATGKEAAVDPGPATSGEVG